MRKRRRLLLAMIVAVGLGAALLSASETYAEGRKKRGAAASVSVRKLAEITAKLESSEPAEVLSGFQLLRPLGKEAASLAPVVEKLLHRGSSIEITEAAIVTLSELGTESASATIRPYARHRRPELRQAAAEALTKTGGLEAVFTLRRSLGDADANVRKAAARGLGTLRAREAVDDLFLALDRGVDEAAPSLGRLCPAPSCERLIAKLHGLPFDIAAGTIEALLLRPEIPDDRKLALIAHLSDLPKEEANAFLQLLRPRLKDASPELQKALEQAISATSNPTETP